MIKLHQFAYSHFNEKARWALTFKGAAHERKTYLPGPHRPAIKKLSGQLQTPVLEMDGAIIAGSAKIIDTLEQHFPTPALYPQVESHRQAALDVQTYFDAEVGPAVRTVVFAELIKNGDYLCHMFGSSKGWLKRAAYRATFPLAKPLIAKGNGADDPANVIRCLDATDRVLDEVADRVAATGFMVGGTFSVADLTVAALLAPIANVRHPDMRWPQPVPDHYMALLDVYANHPAITWVQGIYETFRH